MIIDKINRSNRQSIGFTLIELLVVMGIMAVLAALSLFALQGARESARDAQRRADLETIRSGLELYKADCNQYPSSSGGNVATVLGSSLTGGGPPPASCVATNVYIAEVPNDPVSGKYYYYESGGANNQSYSLCTFLEGGGTASCGSCGGVTCNYEVKNP
ncbi:MAG: type II secretion system protein GspG [Candidatus Woesebacteria bacterium]|jgi:general secretion pathway protein G